MTKRRFFNFWKILCKKDTKQFSDMALIRFVILDDDFIGDEFIGQYTIAYSCLLPGYRVLKLHGIFGEELEGASLLVHIQSSSSRESHKKKNMLRRKPSRHTRYP